MVLRWRFLRPVFSASRVQHVLDLRPKFALRPHHVCIRRLRLGEERKKKEETTGQKYNVRICYAGRPQKLQSHVSDNITGEVSIFLSSTDAF